MRKSYQKQCNCLLKRLQQLSNVFSFMLGRCYNMSMSSFSCSVLTMCLSMVISFSLQQNSLLFSGFSMELGEAVKVMLANHGPLMKSRLNSSSGINPLIMPPKRQDAFGSSSLPGLSSSPIGTQVCFPSLYVYYLQFQPISQ